MAIDRLTALRKQLMAGADAGGALEGMKTQQAQAEALRGTPDPTIGKRSGYLSPLQVIGSTMQQLQGTRDMRRIGKEKAGLSQAVAKANADNLMYGHEKDAAAVDLAAQQYKTEQDRLNEQQDYDRSRTDNRVVWERPDTGERMQTEQIGDGSYVHANGPNRGQRADTTGYVKYDAVSARQLAENTGGSGMRAALETKLALNMRTMAHSENLGRMATSLSTEDRAGLNDKWKNFGKTVVQMVSPQDLEQQIGIQFADESPEVRDFLITLNRMDTEQRLAFFGKALTGVENMNSGKFMSSVLGLGLDEVERRLESAYNTSEINAYSLQDSVGGKGADNALTRHRARYPDPIYGKDGSRARSKAAEPKLSSEEMAKLKVSNRAEYFRRLGIPDPDAVEGQ